MKILILVLFIFSIQMAQARRRWGQHDDPAKILANYESNMSALPIAGKLEKKPWSGDYWATYRGGITYRWLHKTNKFKYDFANASTLTQDQIDKLSPSEKFDLYKGDSNWTLTKLERDRTEVMTKKDIPRWFGLCHAWAPATIMYDSPDQVMMKGKDGHNIPFYASDIKALLTYNIHLLGQKAKTHFMGSRCNVSLPKMLKSFSLGIITEDRYLNMVRKEECDGVDPGAVHVALTNLLGIKKLGFVMDKTRGAEVWNQGVYAFKSVIDKTSKKRKLTWKGLKVIGKKHKIRTQVTWVNEIPHNKRRVSPDKGLRVITYKYEIYTDEDGDIIGGKWLQSNRPDFFWRKEDPGIHPMMVGLNDIYVRSIVTPWKAPAKKRTRHELFNLFRKSARQVRNSQVFIKNTRQLVAARNDERKEYYKDLKKFYTTRYKELMKKYR